MAKNNKTDSTIGSAAPSWPTTSRGRLSNGRVLGAEPNQLWLYRAVPMSPVADARSESDILMAAEPIMSAFDELASMGRASGRRQLVRNSYREFHTLLVDIPQYWYPAQDNPLNGYLSSLFPPNPENGIITRRRVALFGVRLASKTGGGGGFRQALDSVTETLISGGTPIGDYDEDTAKVSSALRRSGMLMPTPEQWDAAGSWWSDGYSPDVPMLEQPAALHFFETPEQVQAAERAVKGGRTDPTEIGSSSVISMVSMQNLEMPWVSPTSPQAQWITELLARGAKVISIRGRIEPAAVTRGEIRRNRVAYRQSIEEGQAANKMDRQEQNDHMQILGDVEAAYASDTAPPTLTETSVVIGFNGVINDIRELSQTMSTRVNAMLYRQRSAWGETMLASHIRANPHLHDIPAQTVAASGLPSLSISGDSKGALQGFSERDGQPVFEDPMAAADDDTLPIQLIIGATGSGKAVVLGTKIPVPVSEKYPTGWATMGDLEVGDCVFASDGSLVTVRFISETKTAASLYKVTFADGQHIKADGNHQWLVTGADKSSDHESLSAELRTLAEPLGESVTKTADEIASMVYLSTGVNEWYKADAVAASLAMMDVEETEGRYPLKAALVALAERLRQRNHATGPAHLDQTVMSTSELLADGLNDEVGNPRFSVSVPDAIDLPHAPTTHATSDIVAGMVGGDQDALPELLRSSVGQRTNALRYLATAKGATLTEQMTEVALAFDHEWQVLQSAELVRSLGIRTTVDLRGKRVVFETDRWTRRADDQSRNDIVKVERIEAEPVKCITVDSEDGTFLAEGFVTTHNTQVGLWLANQWARLGHPVIFVDPKPNSDHSAAVLASGGQVVSLDNLNSDGIYDPIWFSQGKDIATGVKLAASILMSVNPWGNDLKRFEVPLIKALNFGVSQGAKTIGQALLAAKKASTGKSQEGVSMMVDPCFDLAESDPMFRAIFGIDPPQQSIGSFDGITLIKVGSSDIELPDAGTPIADQTLSKRIGGAMVRMMVFGSTMALTEREGVVMLDEAWVFMGAGKDDMERLGRLARSMRVFPVLITQRVTDALNAGLAGYISRGIILAIKDDEESLAACKLFKVDPTPERLSRIRAEAFKGGAGGSREPDWNSMRALRDPLDPTKVLRGSIGYNVDISGRCVPVEHRLPTDWLNRASTNKRDIDARKAKEKQARLFKEANPSVAEDLDIVDPGGWG